MTRSTVAWCLFVLAVYVWSYVMYGEPPVPLWVRNATAIYVGVLASLLFLDCLRGIYKELLDAKGGRSS